MPKNLNRPLVLVFWLLGVSVVMPVQADLAGDFAGCRSISNSQQRLACFDALAALPAGQAPASAQAPSPPLPAPAASTSMPEAKEQSFGAESLARKGSGSEAVTLSARVVGQLDGIRRNMEFRLDNGQIWKNVDDREYDYEADHPAVTIERNYIGTYWMQLADANFRVRVRRMR